ncbi:alpha/beta hydrolase [Hamadaea tsunoensis]|uniref:alpha/beta hydrolase n=1 Tax=Hamadaea tsunoensis TaxID=53368 RepID=UPI000424DCCA|nr:alpha/beta hydrolase-fold protein [Hamadaea tsunoensis]
MRDWSLVTGVVPGVVVIIGALALVYLLARRSRRWWLVQVPVAAAVSAGLVLLAAYLVNNVFQLFPDPLPTEVLVWLGVAVFALLLAVMRPTARLAARDKPSPAPGSRWYAWIASIVAALLVILACGAQINSFYAQYPTLGSLFGTDAPELTAFGDVNGKQVTLIAPPPGGTLSQVWSPPAGMPAQGAVSEVPIPGTISGFPARPAYVYLPPAYLVQPRAQLPVLMLLPGQPGGPSDWFDTGQITKTLDAYARSHKGLAPVVVAPDATGSTFANTLCADTSRGHAATYLTQDVPNWIKDNLQVAGDRGGWGVGGYSFGGTCALQTALYAPATFASFIDISGQDEPTLGSRERTVNEAFGGDAAAFAKVNPADILKSVRFPATAGYFAVGDHDSTYRPQQQAMYAACQSAGLAAEYHELPGGHSWGVWRPAIAQALPWFAARAQLSN